MSTEGQITVDRETFERVMADPGKFVGRKIELEPAVEHEEGLERLIDWQWRALLAALDVGPQGSRKRRICAALGMSVPFDTDLEEAVDELVEEADRILGAQSPASSTIASEGGGSGAGLDGRGNPSCSGAASTSPEEGPDLATIRKEAERVAASWVEQEREAWRCAGDEKPNNGPPPEWDQFIALLAAQSPASSTTPTSLVASSDKQEGSRCGGSGSVTFDHTGDSNCPGCPDCEIVEEARGSQLERIEQARRGIQQSDAYKRPWPEPASAYELAKAAVLALDGQPDCSQPPPGTEEPTGAICVRDIAEENRRVYSHDCEDGGGEWSVPLDDAPIPAERDCELCGRTEPVWALGDEPVSPPPGTEGEFPDECWVLTRASGRAGGPWRAFVPEPIPDGGQAVRRYVPAAPGTVGEGDEGPVFYHEIDGKLVACVPRDSLEAELGQAEFVNGELVRLKERAEEEAESAEQKLEETRGALGKLIDHDLSGERLWLTGTQAETAAAIEQIVRPEPTDKEGGGPLEDFTRPPMTERRSEALLTRPPFPAQGGDADGRPARRTPESEAASEGSGAASADLRDRGMTREAPMGERQVPQEAVTAVRADRDRREAAGLDRSFTGKHLRGHDIAADLRAAYPAIRREVLEEVERALEGEQAVEAAKARLRLGPGDYLRNFHVRRAIRAALATLTEDPSSSTPEER